MSTEPEHQVTVMANSREVFGWSEYQLDTSLVEPADSVSLTRPFDQDAWDTCTRDARIRVLFDGQPRFDGYIDRRSKKAKDGTMTIEARDRCGRLVQESAPHSAYGGQTLLDVIKALVSPWYQDVVFDNARNRRVQLGKGSKAPASSQPIALIKGTLSAKTRPARIDPGLTRWAVIEDLLSKAGLAAWGSCDAREFIVGKPDQTQPAIFAFRHAAAGGQSNVIDLEYVEDNQDRFSFYMALGSGATSPTDYGDAVCGRSGVVLDNEGDRVNGTGRDFLFPKRLVIAEHGLQSNAEASRVAGREQFRRDFRRTTATITVHHHGQKGPGASSRTLFATDTMARVVDEEIDLDEDFLIFAVSLRASRADGQTTVMKAVPRGTEIIL